MAGKNIVARPYAKAIFEYALTDNAFDAWSQLLSIAAHVVQDPHVAKLFTDPHRTPAELACFVIDVCGKCVTVTKAASNLIELLAVYRRLPVLPQIFALFEAYRAEHEKRLDVHVIASQTLTAEMEQALKQALKKRFHREITLSSEVDATLLSGAIVRIGDQVIDGSLRGRLTRLAETIDV